MKALYVPGSDASAAGAFGANKVTKYTPAISVMEKKRIKEKYKTFNLSWWDEQSFFKHNALLCSAFYGMKDCWNYREEYKIPKDFLLIADSGGFEQATQKIRIEPINVLKWQENNANIAFILDVPPINPENLQPIQDLQTFTKYAEATKRNADIAQRNRTNNDMKLYYVLQGNTKQKMDLWIKDVDLSHYDGLAVGPKPPNDPLQIALHGCYAKDKGIKIGHVLLGTGYNSVPIIVYLSKKLFPLTFDSSSYGKGARTMSYDIPSHRLDIKFGKSFNQNLKNLPCDCPVCSNISIPDFQTGKSVSGALISLHNLYLYIKHIEFLNNIVEDEELYLRYITKYCTKKTVSAFNFINSYLEKGFDDTYKIFFRQQNTLNNMFR